MTSLLLEAASWVMRCSLSHRCHLASSRAAAARFGIGTASVGGGLAASKTRVCGIAGVSRARGGRDREKRGREGEAARRVIPGSAVAAVAGTFSGQRRIKATVATKAAHSLYAEELARCETSSQVLQLLNTSPSSNEDGQNPQPRFRQQGRLTCRDSVALPYLLPVDCLAFLNALLRVQHLRRSGAEFLFFCDALEDALQRYNAHWVPPTSSDAPQNSATVGWKGILNEGNSLQQDIQNRNVYADIQVGGDPAIARRPRRPPPHAGRFVRLVLQKLSELKAPLAFNQMVPYLAPHVPVLAPFDVAECLWSFAMLQPPDWRVSHVSLLTQLLQRLLDLKRPTSEGRSEASVCTGGALHDASGRHGNPCGGEANATFGENIVGVNDRTTAAALADIGEHTFFAKHTEWRSSQKTRKQGALQQSLKWVAQSSGEGQWQIRSKAESTADQVLLLDDLSNLMIYRVVFGVAKLDFRCRIAQQVYQALAPRIVRRLREQEVEAFPPTYLVRMAWAYARLRVRHVPFYGSTCKVLRGVLEDLSYQELKVVKHVYKALELSDRVFLDAVDLLLHQRRELSGNR